MNPADNQQNNLGNNNASGFSSSESPPPPPAQAPPSQPISGNFGSPAPMSPPMAPPPASTPLNNAPPSYEQGTPTISSSGGSGKKKILIIVIALLALSALGVGAYFIASRFLSQDQGVAPEPTPIAEEEVTAICLNIKAYDSQWNRLSLSELSSLKPGDVVRLSVAGDTSSGNFDMARFSVNSISLGETTQLKPDSDEYYDEYIIPENVESFSVEAQIHHQQLDQWI